MSLTRPTGDQLKFVSSKTGEHVLDDYLEAAEKGTRTIGDMLEDIFNPTTGDIKPDFIQVRVSNNSELQVRIGPFVDPEAGWVGTGSYILRARGEYATGTLYKQGDLVNLNNGAYICKEEHTSSGAINLTKFTTILDTTFITTQVNSATTSANTATTQADIATTQATNADNARVAAEAARNLAEAIADALDDKYLGTKTSDPTVDNDGNALSIGALYYNSVGNVIKVYNGTLWQNAAPPPSAVIAYSQTFSGNGSTTAFTLSNVPYSAKSCAVYIAGVRKVDGTDFTLTGAILTFTVAPASGTNNIYVTWTTPTGSIDQVGTSILLDGAVTQPKIAATAYASQAQAEAGTDTVFLMSALRVAQAITQQVFNRNNVFQKSQAGAIAALTDASTVALDLSRANNFSLLMTSAVGNTRELDNPTNVVPGQSGIIAITQDATGGRNITFDTNFKFASGVVPTLTTTANAVDYLSYYCETSNRIFVSQIRDVK